jgi:hypothetical protein
MTRTDIPERAHGLRETLMDKVGEYGEAMYSLAQAADVAQTRERFTAQNALFTAILRLSSELRDLSKEG